MGAVFSRVLLATDGSAAAAGALRAALQMVQRCQSRLSVLTMVVSNPETEALIPELVRKSEEQAHSLLARVEHDARAGGVSPDLLVRHGDEAYEEIVGAATDCGADLIVVGRRGHRSLMRRLMGSTTSGVIGHAHCPVLVVPRAAGLPERRILIATDGSPSAQRATRLAVAVSGLCGVPLSVLSVSPPRRSAERHQETEAIVANAVAMAAAEGVEAEPEIAEGREHEVIIDVARRIGSDLIVLGSHGRTAFGRLLMGSTTERVIGLTECAVLVSVFGAE